MKKILVPIDFSDDSSHALDFAIAFNEILNGSITLVHVIELPSSSLKVMGDAGGNNQVDKFYISQFLKRTEERLEEWTQRVAEAGQKVYFQLKEGNPYSSISKALAEIEADWIIMGTKGASGLKEIFVGSNAERMIRYAACPVITINGISKLKDMKSMVFATDLSLEQEWIVEQVRELQLMLNLKIHILKVRTRYNLATERETEAQLKNFAEKHFINYTTHSVEAGLTYEGMLAFAEETKAGMVVLGTHGKTGLAHFFGGSRAEELANRAHIPVVTFKLPLA